jgi:zinc protease
VRRALAVLGTVLALAAPGGAPAATTITDLGGGERVYVRADPAALLAGVEIAVRAGLDRETGSQNGLAALVAECVLRTPVVASGSPTGTTPQSLADAVDAQGASVRYAVGLQNVRFYLEGTPAALAAAAPLVAAALKAPSFDAATLASARARLGERIAGDEADPRTVGRAMLRAAYYRGGGAMPPFGTAASLAAAGPADARAFYGAWYRRADAVAAAAGRTGAETDAAGRAMLDALPAGAAATATPLAAKPFAAQPRRLVTQREALGPYVLLGFAAPPLGDRDFPAALVLKSLLSGLVERPSALALGSLFQTGGSSYAYDASPAHFVLWINGLRTDPDIPLTAVTAVAKATAAKPLTAAVLSRYKTLARGEWLLESVSVDAQAGAVANAVSHGLGPDAPDDVAAAIGRVTSADVQRVAKKYFQKFDVALVVPRGSAR